MFNRGLSLDQAPPISVVFRFFLTIPLFGVLAALAMLAADPYTFLEWNAPRSVAIVHLLLLGMAGMAMVGSLFQMLPVLAGASISDPLYHARWVHLLLLLGTLLISASFFFDSYILMHAALPFLLGSLGFVILLMLAKLAAVENRTPSVKGMAVSLTSLGFGLGFALLLGLVFIEKDPGLDPLRLRDIHMHFMLLGWIGGLIMAVAFQVIEMFYVTPPYPKMVRETFPAAILVLTLLYAVAAFAAPALLVPIDLLLGLLFLLFAAVTLRRLMQRKRPVADATVWLWRTGLAALVAAVAAFAGSVAFEIAALLDAAALLYGYFVLSVIFAMSYKIVPFLVWFHLNAKGVLECPMMGDIIPAKRAMWHLWLHWALLASALLLCLTPYASIAMGTVFLAESLLYGANILRAARLYNSLKEKGIL
ncbi:hypothetical protein [Hydrogenimonas sp.]